MRTRIDSLMAIGGLVVISLQVLLLAAAPLEFAVGFLCTLLIAAGLSGLGRRLQPSNRIYLELRAEVDQFLTLVRKMNAHAVAAEGEQAAVTKTAMHESVDRIALAAGVMEGERREAKKKSPPTRIRKSRRPQEAPTPAAGATWVAVSEEPPLRGLRPN